MSSPTVCMYVYMCPRAHTLFVKCMGLERAGTRGINADRIGFNVTLKLRSETSGTNLCPQWNTEYGIRALPGPVWNTWNTYSHSRLSTVNAVSEQGPPLVCSPPGAACAILLVWIYTLCIFAVYWYLCDWVQSIVSVCPLHLLRLNTHWKWITTLVTSFSTSSAEEPG